MLTCVSFFMRCESLLDFLGATTRHDTCDIGFCLMALISPFHILYKVVDHDQKESCAQMWYLDPAFCIRLRSFTRTPQLCTRCNARTPRQFHHVPPFRMSPPQQGIHHRPPGESRSPPARVVSHQIYACRLFFFFWFPLTSVE